MARSTGEAGIALTINSPSDKTGESDELPILIKEYTTEQTLTFFVLGVLPRLHGYAGWNTSCNTVGTTIAKHKL